MKVTLILLIILFLVACTSTNPKKAEQTFPIPSYLATQKNPSANVAAHKPGDVEVFRLISKDTFYFTRLYRNESGETRAYETTIRGGNAYDKMFYKWLNDSTVLFTLIDSKSDKSQEIQLMGSNAVTTVQ